MEQFHRKLLEPGWVGCLTPDQARHIQQALKRRPDLKKKWGIRGAVTLNKVARAALPDEPDKGEEHLQKLLAAERRKKSPQTTKRAQNRS